MNFYPESPFIIADIGSNFKRTTSTEEDKVLAIKQIERAAKCGVNAVKFQLYTHKELFGIDGDDHWALPAEWLPSLFMASKDNGVEFMCTAFSESGVRVVNEFVGVHKIASSEMRHIGILDAVIETGKPVIISTGGAHYLEVDWLEEFLKDALMSDYCLLECVASYPAIPSDYNLEWIRKRSAFKRQFGVSDHTLSNTLANTAVGMGASVFEKHFDALSGCGYGETPDSCVSIGEADMVSYVKSIKDAFQAVKDRKKRPAPSEGGMILRHKRRVVCIEDIKPGERLVIGKNYGVFRVKEDDYRGAEPVRAEEFNGKSAKALIKAGSPIWFDDVNGN